MRRAPASAALAIALSSTIVGCGVIPGSLGNLGARPTGPNIVEPVVQVAGGNGPSGPYTAWVYRTRDGMTCLEVSTQGSGGSSCGPDIEGLLGTGVASGDGGVHVSGGTRRPGAQSVRVTLADGSTVQSALVPVPAAFGAPDVRLYVVALAAGAVPTRVEVLDAAGNELEVGEF